eukprot:8268865-Alexandrium_andersonii.AAC.1
MPLAQERAGGDGLRDAMVLHFSGSQKPSWLAWYVGRREATAEEWALQAERPSWWSRGGIAGVAAGL